MAKPNYQFERRRKDLEKKAKKEAKKQRKLEAANAPATENAGENGDSPTPPAEAV